MLRTLLRTVLVAAFFATLLLPATPAAAAETTYTLTTNNVSFTRDGQSFKLNLSATQGSDGDYMTATISKVSNPDGVAWAQQSQTYSWFFNGDRFVPLAANATSTLKTSAEMGDYGNIAVTLKKTNGPTSSCGGTVKKWSGPLSGSVTLNTGSPLFGTIRAVPTAGTLYSNTGYTCYAPGHPTNACPTPGLSVYGYRFPATGSGYTSVGATLPSNTTSPATLYFSSSAQLPASKTNAPGHFGRLVMTRAPRSDVAIASGLASATLKGEPGTWVSGTGTFASNGGAEQGPPNACAGGKEYIYTYRPGVLNGSLAANVWTGADIAVGSNMEGSAQKVIVRAR